MAFCDTCNNENVCDVCEANREAPDCNCPIGYVPKTYFGKELAECVGNFYFLMSKIN